MKTDEKEEEVKEEEISYSTKICVVGLILLAVWGINFYFYTADLENKCEQEEQEEFNDELLILDRQDEIEQLKSTILADPQNPTEETISKLNQIISENCPNGTTGIIEPIIVNQLLLLLDGQCNQ